MKDRALKGDIQSQRILKQYSEDNPSAKPKSLNGNFKYEMTTTVETRELNYIFSPTGLCTIVETGVDDDKLYLILIHDKLLHNNPSPWLKVLDKQN